MVPRRDLAAGAAGDLPGGQVVRASSAGISRPPWAANASRSAARPPRGPCGPTSAARGSGQRRPVPTPGPGAARAPPGKPAAPPRRPGRRAGSAIDVIGQRPQRQPAGIDHLPAGRGRGDQRQDRVRGGRVARRRARPGRARGCRGERGSTRRSAGPRRSPPRPRRGPRRAGRGRPGSAPGRHACTPSGDRARGKGDVVAVVGVFLGAVIVPCPGLQHGDGHGHERQVGLGALLDRVGVSRRTAPALRPGRRRTAGRGWPPPAAASSIGTRAAC